MGEITPSFEEKKIRKCYSKFENEETVLKRGSSRFPLTDLQSLWLDIC